MNFFSLLFPCVVMTFIMLLKALLSVQLCYCGCSCWASSCSCSAGPVWTSNRRKDLPKGFRAESWLNVWFLVYLRVEMCLVWSWFCLSFNFFFELARWCYCYLFRWSACLFIWASSSFFFFETFMLQVLEYTDALSAQGLHFSLPPLRLSLPRSLCPPRTPTHSTTPKISPQTLSPPHDSLFLLCCKCAASLTDWLSCFLTVTESQWAG